MFVSTERNTSLIFLFFELVLILQLCVGFPRNGKVFRVMTFNTWECGAKVNDGLNKIIKHINLVQPDLIALQEINYNTKTCYSNISTLLGPKWYKDIRIGGYPDNAIFSRWPIINGSHEQTSYGTSVSIEYEWNNTRSSTINMTIWSVHFDWSDYGPEAACNKHVTQKAQIMAGELGSSGRVKNALHIANHPSFIEALRNTDTKPLILTGDFNCPSHLDWIDATKSSHCGWSFKWPATSIFADLGMKDSYREMHPDPQLYPGITYSDVYKFIQPWGYTIPYPRDRIDLLLYKSHKLKVEKSIIYKGDKPIHPMPHHKDNDWPSDHYAVVSDFIAV